MRYRDSNIECSYLKVKPFKVMYARVHVCMYTCAYICLVAILDQGHPLSFPKQQSPPSTHCTTSRCLGLGWGVWPLVRIGGAGAFARPPVVAVDIEFLLIGVFCI